MTIQYVAAWIVASVMATSSPLSGATPFTWGVNGRTIGAGGWADPEGQFAIMSKRGLKTYRFDVKLTDDAPNPEKRLTNLIALAKKYRITLHPILFVPFTWGDATDKARYPPTEAGLESQGYNRVYPFVLRFAHEIRDWEMENEVSLVKGVKNGDGETASDFDTPKGNQWAALLRGMSKAIAKVRADTGQPLRSVVDMVYVDSGFIPFLESKGVLVDKLAYHYYYGERTDPHRVSAPHGPKVNLFVALPEVRKPIIINEFNAAEIYSPRKGIPYDEVAALKSLKRHIEYLIEQKQAAIEGVELYELYDEPGKGSVESNFGLMKDSHTPKPQIFLVSAYTCGELSPNEQATLVSLGVFTAADLATVRASCSTH